MEDKRMSKINHLEHAARAAFRAGVSWQDYHDANRGTLRDLRQDVGKGEYHTLLDRLLGLVTSGDCDGLTPIDVDAEPGWEVDDRLGHDLPVDDTTTSATVQTSFPWTIDGGTP
jgi:hypothetical protein